MPFDSTRALDLAEQLEQADRAMTKGEWFADDRGWIVSPIPGDDRSGMEAEVLTLGADGTREDLHAVEKLRNLAASCARALREACDLAKHYDRAAPEHNLLALLDLYEERERQARADCEAMQVENERLRADNVALRDQIPPEHFPVLGGPSVPWSLVAPHEQQARNNHDQSLRRLAERGGLSPGELWCIVHDKKWREQPDEKTALTWLRSWAGIGVEGACDALRAQINTIAAEVARLRPAYEAAVAWFVAEHTGDANCMAGDHDDCDARTKEGLLRVRIAESMGREPDRWDLRRAGLHTPKAGKP